MKSNKFTHSSPNSKKNKPTKLKVFKDKLKVFKDKWVTSIKTSFP
jgi:hypothetical protein